MAGVNNRHYAGVCAGLDEATFLRYHRAGQLVYQARQDLTQNQGRLNRLGEDLKKASTEDERKRLRDELARAERERTRLTALIVALELAGPPR
jgi:predicted  nucleic acid-binding Zn-ribbon protein